MIKEKARKFEIINCNTVDGLITFQQNISKLIISPSDTTISYGIKFIQNNTVGDQNEYFLYTGDLTLENINIKSIYVNNNSHTAAITDESFTSNFDTPVSLAHNDIVDDGSVNVTTTDDVTTYTEGADYTIDYTNGTITVLSTGTMADATSYYIDYSYYDENQDLSLLAFYF